MTVRRCPQCSAPLRRDLRHLNGDDSQFCDLNETALAMDVPC